MVFLWSKLKHLVVKNDLVHYESKGEHILLLRKQQLRFFLVVLILRVGVDVNLGRDVGKSVAWAIVYINSLLLGLHTYGW